MSMQKNIQKKQSDQKIQTEHNELLNFTQRYIELWQTIKGTEPYSEAYSEIDSPCIVKKTSSGVFWLPQKENKHSFCIVEEVMNLRINPIANHFYCVQLSGDLFATWENKEISLIQIWNDADFRNFEGNLLSHLEMQRRRKLRPTIFIGTTDDESELISIDNQTGKIWLENLVTKTQKEIASNLNEFLIQLMPCII